MGNPCDQMKEHEPPRNRSLCVFSTRRERAKEIPFVCASQRSMELLHFPSNITTAARFAASRRDLGTGRHNF